jgi:hypothetical protein
VPNTIRMDEHTPIHGLPLERDEPRARVAHPGASQVAAMDFADSHDTPPARRGLNPWLLVLALLGAGGGGGSVVAGIGSLTDSDAVQAIEQDIEAQDDRLDAHDDALETLRREQIAQHRWVASELIKQSRGIARIAAKVGAEVDVEVEAYQSGGL